MKKWLCALWNKTKAVIMHELRANTSPMRAALSLAFGILIGFSPFYGLHTVVGLPLAFLLKLNRPMFLLAASTTILPFVPIWVAAGIFTGRLVVSLDTAAAIIHKLRWCLPGSMCDTAINNLAAFCKRLFPHELFGRVATGGGHGFLDGFVQWAIGTSVLAIVCAILTFAVSYILFVRRAELRRKRSLEKPDTAK